MLRARVFAGALLALTAWSSIAARPFAGKHMLFRARGPGGATVYLLGSVHLLSAEAGALPPEVDSAFAHAKTIAFETSLDSLQARAMELLSIARLPAGQTLRSSLTPAGAAKADSILKLYGLSVDQLAQFKPWFASLVPTQITMAKAKFEAQYGVDFQLNARAHTANKPIVGLESVDFQMHLFDSFTPTEQERMLVMVSPPDSAVTSLVKIKDAWVAGDIAALDSMLNKSLSESPALFAKLVSERNKSWVPQIDAMLKGKDDALVVVGAAHLVGRQGVVELLRARGYTVDQL